LTSTERSRQHRESIRMYPAFLVILVLLTIFSFVLLCESWWM
jgi:hypothetical protein